MNVWNDHLITEFNRLCSGECRENFTAFIRRLGVDAHTAEDIVQETFLCAWGQREQFKGKSTLSTWIHGIGCRQVLRHHRYQKITVSLLEKLLTLKKVSNPISDAVEMLLPKEILEVLCEHLSDEHFRALYMDSCEEYSDAEISHMLGVALGTIKTRLYHARRKAAHILTEAGYDVPTSFL